MSFTFTLTSDQKTSRIDEKSKTSYQLPTLIKKSLSACVGGENHVAASESFSINLRADCRPPVPALIASFKSLNRVIGDSTPLATRLDQLVGYIVDTLWLAGSDEDITKIIVSGGSWSSDMRNHIYTFSDKSMLTVTVPTYTVVKDPCGDVAGAKVTASLTKMGYNPVTCLSVLEETITVGFTLIESWLGVPIPWLATDYDKRFAALYTQPYSNFIKSFSYDDTKTIAENQTDFRTSWESKPPLNTVVTMGA